MSYRPEQQSIPARIFTTAGWVTGHVRAPKGRRWLEHMNSCGHWLKLTDARVPSQLLSHRDERAGIAMLSLSFYDIWTWWVHAPIWISIPTLGALLFALRVALGLFAMFFEN